MLSYSAWQTRFGGQPDVLGRTVTLQSPWLLGVEPHVVIGVLPPDFHFTMAEHAEFWATIRGPQACWDVRSCRSLEAVARLADDVSMPTATANMTAVLEQLRREYPDDYRDREIAKLVPLRDVMLGDVRPILLMLLGGAGLLLTIACINVVSLLLARSDSRTREIAVRNALGASSARLVLQFATEAFVLAGIGCCARIDAGRMDHAVPQQPAHGRHDQPHAVPPGNRPEPPSGGRGRSGLGDRSLGIHADAGRSRMGPRKRPRGSRKAAVAPRERAGGASGRTS